MELQGVKSLLWVLLWSSIFSPSAHSFFLEWWYIFCTIVCWGYVIYFLQRLSHRRVFGLWNIFEVESLWGFLKLDYVHFVLWYGHKPMGAGSRGDGLNENGHLWFICLNNWFIVGRTVWEGRGVTLLKEVWHWNWALRFQKTHAVLSVLSASCWRFME